MQIKREDLIRLAHEALEYTSVEQDVRDDVLRGAETMPQVAVNRWVVNPECACLVGTYALEQLSPAERASDEGDLSRFVLDFIEGVGLRAPGMRFDRLLRAHLGDDPRPGYGPDGPVDVIG